jgi:hypothetical protein
MAKKSERQGNNILEINKLVKEGNQISIVSFSSHENYAAAFLAENGKSCGNWALIFPYFGK